jgi:hypothetical protein
MTRRKTTTTDLTLFDLPAAPDKPKPGSWTSGPCRTCGATRPDDYPRAMFLEPVSGECFDCNHATIAEMFRAGRAGDQTTYSAAWKRHHSRH